MNTHLNTTAPSNTDQSTPSIPSIPSISSITPHDSIPDLWDQASQYAFSAGRFAHASLACQIMCGFTLLELKRLYGRRPGRPTTDTTNEFEEHLDIHVGISPTTAWRWMRMAQAVKPRLKRLGAADRLRALISSDPSNWSDTDASAVETAIKHLTDGRTQSDFLAELGLLKKPAPAPRPKTDQPDPSDQPQSTRSIESISSISSLQSIAIKDWGTIEKLITAYDAAALFTHLDAAIIQAQCATLETALQARRKHISNRVQ